MAPLRVEYAKSGRAKCALSSCKKTIAKHEVRIGTVITLPFGDEGTESVSWRHVCCFTARQLENAKASNDINNIQGYDDLAPADKALIDQMGKGELVGKTELIGRVGDVANSSVAAALGATGAKAKGGAAKKDATAAPKPKRAKKERAATAKPADSGDDVESDATEEFEVDVRAITGKPTCPYGANCFRTAPEHFAQFSHGDADEDGEPTTADSGAPAVRPVIVSKKRVRS